MPQDNRLSNIFGTLSILFWLGAQFPQVIVNIKAQSVEGLALPFLANWLFGDVSNLVGCILTRQLPFQTYLAAYFCCVDFCLIAQYLYYYKPPSEESSPVSASTPLLEEGLAHSVVERYGSTGSRRYSGVSASYPPPGLLPSSGDAPTHGLSISRSRSRVRALSLRGPTLSKRATLRELQTTAASIAQAADSLLHQQHGHQQRPRSASYVGDSRLSALSRTSMGAAICTPRFGEPKSDVEDDEVNLLAESFYSEAGGSHPRHRSITWTNDHPPSSSQSQPIEQRQVHGGEESEDATLNGEMHSTSLRQRSRSRGRPTTRLLFESTPLDTVPGSYVENPQEPSIPGVEGTLDALKRHRMSTSGNRARGKRSAGIVFLSVGVGVLFAFGTRMSATKEVGEGIGSAVEMGEGRVLGIGRGYPLQDQETGTMRSDHTDVHTPLANILYANIDDEPPLPPHHRHERPERTREEKRRIVGRISAWTCTTLYLTSRLPQIWKNFTRKSVQGLSLALFVFAFLGNLFYVLSILTSPVLYSPPQTDSPSSPGLSNATSLPPPLLDADALPKTGWSSPAGRIFLRESLPYLLGSGGTLIFDITIVTQGMYYKRRERQLEEGVDEEAEEEEEVREAEQEPLLTGAEARH